MTRQHFARLLFTLTLVGCRAVPATAPRPVRKQIYEPAAGLATELVVLLPGRFSRPEEFEEKEIVALVRQRRPSARIIAPDLHLRYYLNRTAGTCLWEEIIAPAKDRGLPVTLIGVSLGGLGALITALEHPSAIREVLLLAPYLGENKLGNEIRAAGGLREWNPQSPHTSGQDQAMRLLWARLRSCWLQPAGPPMSVSLACGKGDRHLPMNRLLAEATLPKANWHELKGGHDWRTWRQAAELMLK